jgi:hypothetical protein
MTVTVTLEQARAWIEVDAVSISDEQLQGVLAAETETQARACRIDPLFVQESLNQALLRRVSRAVAARSLPTGLVGDPLAGVSRLPGYDAEIERYERPWRLVVFG